MRYRVYYAREPTFVDDPVDVERIDQTHVFVREVEARTPDDAYTQMQGENWSPNGEARPLIERLGVHHTSMSVGDLLRDASDTYWQCLVFGWREIRAEQAHEAACAENAPQT
jgi:hypothetical protein